MTFSRQGSLLQLHFNDFFDMNNKHLQYWATFINKFDVLPNLF